jgi:succinate dehydrogenase flavin-adding protein (antitoxin of CptAB toxin-antitoxin module)
MDLLMGGFARARLPTMTESELSAFEDIIELPDQELLSGSPARPPCLQHSAMLPELLKFRP